MVKIFHVSKSSNCQFRLFMAIDIFNVNGFFFNSVYLSPPFKSKLPGRKIKVLNLYYGAFM